MDEVYMKPKLREFVLGLSERELRNELIAAYLQFERCRRVLRGEDVEPVDMKDNGYSSDLELFYQCRKCADELAYLNNELSGMVDDGEEDEAN